MILRPIILLSAAYGIVAAFYAICTMLKLSAPTDPFTAFGLLFSLGLGALVLLTGLRLAYAAGLLSAAVLMMVLPVLTWALMLLRDPLGLQSHRAEQALIDRLYPPPSPKRRSYAQA